MSTELLPSPQPLIVEEPACAASGAPDPFPPGLRDNARAAHIVAAVSTCGGCLSRLACLAYARRTQPDDGVWGGLWWGDQVERGAGVPEHLLARPTVSIDPAVAA